MKYIILCGTSVVYIVLVFVIVNDILTLQCMCEVEGEDDTSRSRRWSMDEVDQLVQRDRNVLSLLPSYHNVPPRD